MHTEESLMQLAQASTIAAAKSPYLGENHFLAAQDALRLAIREVLAERDGARKGVEQTALVNKLLIERAERAEAECERLRAERQGKIDENPGHEYWLTASHDEILDALRFQGAITKELIPYQNECERLRKDAERGRFMLKHGEWRRNSEYRTAHLAVAVPFDSDLSCYATREAAIDAAMQEGK